MVESVSQARRIHSPIALCKHVIEEFRDCSLRGTRTSMCKGRNASLSDFTREYRVSCVDRLKDKSLCRSIMFAMDARAISS